MDPLAALKSHLCIVPRSGSSLSTAAFTTLPPLLQTAVVFHQSLISCFLFSPLHQITSMPHHVSLSIGKITTKDLKEKEVVEEAHNGQDTPAHGTTNEENGEQEADNEVDEDEEGGNKRKVI